MNVQVMKTVMVYGMNISISELIAKLNRSSYADERKISLKLKEEKKKSIE